MPFSFTPKSAGDLIRSQDWNAAMTAISALYDKLNAATGHRHTGGVEDAPQIPTAGIADLAVITAKLADLVITTNKLANLAVTNAKLAAGAVDITKMQNNSVGSPQIIDGSVTAAELANLAVTTAKLADLSVTAGKLAPGVAPEIGVAISSVGDGQTAAIPSGFVASECRFLCALKTVSWNNITSGSSIGANTTIDSNGVVFIGTSGNPGWMFATVLAIAKRGGW